MNRFFGYNNTYNKIGSTEDISTSNFENLQKARADLIDEIGAIIQYDDHIHTSQDKHSRQTWQDIKGEELTHVGELLALLDYLDPSQKQYVQNGIEEFNQRMKS